MKKILIFAGTTEGRKLSERLSEAEIAHHVCVATEYGEIVMKESPFVVVRRGRMDRDEMSCYIKNESFDVVVDATHPYAAEATENIRGASGESGALYLRLMRDLSDGDGGDSSRIIFATMEDCAEALERTEGNILLTTGSRELAAFCQRPGLRERLYVRVLPGMESLKLCMEQGISGRQILAMQGPFSEEMNEATIRQYQIRHMVTKSSGRAGGFWEKRSAAERAGIPLYVVGDHSGDSGYSFAEVCGKLEELCGKRILQEKPWELILAGAGMGGKAGVTEEVRRALEDADILLGAERLIAAYQPKIEKRPYYWADQILSYLKKMQRDFAGETLRVVILFSGDVGFYSGCGKLLQALEEEIHRGELRAVLRVLPGISSVTALAASIGEDYQDADIYSIHGRKISNLARKIERSKKTFLLMSGPEDVRELGRILTEAGLEECRVAMGWQLSYPDQEIRSLTPGQCCEVEKPGLYVCCVKNPRTQEYVVTPGRPDLDFIRGDSPMTKEEIREVSICKLRLHGRAVAYDVGSGTGSVAVEMAERSDDIQVFAMEHKSEVVRLIEENKRKFHLDNVEIVAGEAPECFEGLPAPTHVFIGGSGGRLADIFQALCEKKRNVRVVINAVTLETVSEIRELLSLYPVEEEEIVQIQASQAEKRGPYHLMRAENPVWICSFNLRGGKEA